VGCDLKLGSPKKVDECGICGGDGSKCTSPIYNWEMLATGPCTLNCGGGKCDSNSNDMYDVIVALGDVTCMQIHASLFYFAKQKCTTYTYE